MKTTLLALAALSIAGPALAGDWSKGDWYVFEVPVSVGQLRVADTHAGGWYPPNASQIPGPYYSNIGRVSRSKVAVDIGSISRVGNALDVRYFVWADKRSGVTEINSRIDCSRSGETVVQSREFDEGFTAVSTTEEGWRRIDAMSMAVADHACRLPASRRVSDKSLPEIVQGRS